MYIVPKCNNQYGIPVILEIGSLNTRIGFAGKDRPDTVVPSYVAVERNTNIRHEMDFYNITAKENCDPEAILEGCFIQELDNAHVVMEYGIGKKLLINPADHPMFFVQPVLNSRQHRQKLIETLFENFQFNGIYMHKAQVLSTYLFAKQSAMIVDVGAEYTHVVPVIEGFICNKAVVRAEIGGQTLTRELYKTITQKSKMMSKYTNRASITSSMEMFGALQIVREIKHQECKLLQFRVQNLKYNQSTDKTAFQLPDKTKIDLGKQLWTVPELHFVDSPNINYRGLQNLIYQSFQKCEPEHRKQLFSNIQVVGGGSAFTHFVERLQKQLNDNDVFGYSNKLKIFTTADKEEKFCSSWLGASIMASMAGFDKWVISKREYEQNGAIQIQKKL